MSEIEKASAERSNDTVPQYEVPASSELEQWARDAHLIAGVAVNLVKTAFVPASFEGNAATATAAILTGQEIGLKPMAALRSIDVIKGTPAMRAVAMRALVQAAGHDIWTAESNTQRAIVKGQRRGSDKVETSEWTIDRARQLGLLGKENWQKQPTAMLLARATSECARLIAADVLLGIPYSVEELQDSAPVADVAPAAEAPKSSAKRTVRRKPLPARVAEPDLPGEAPKGEAVESPVEPEPEEPERVTEEPEPPIDERDPAEPTPDEVEQLTKDRPVEPVPAAPVGGWPVRPVPRSDVAEPIPFPEPEFDWDGPGGGDAA